MAIIPRRPKGPPLNALRAFEAAARSGSFVSAAEELGVTAGAISQHVKAVEAWTGATLFERSAHGVSLSSSAHTLTDELTQAFDLLAAAAQSLRNLAPNPEIHIAALPSVAQLWLPARLGKLRENRPDLNVSVTAMENPPSLVRDLYDLSVFISEPDPAVNQIVLEDDEIFPVCAPLLADNLNLTDAPLLHDQTWEDDWPVWSEATDTDVGDATRGPRYSLYALAVEEAKAGAGVLMGHASLVAHALHLKQLERVSWQAFKTGKALIMELPHPSRCHPEIKQVVDLLREG